MTRSLPKVASRARRKKVLTNVKGFYGRRKNTIRAAHAAEHRAGQFAYRDRRRKKRDFRSLWIQRINAGARLHGLTYGRLINGLKLAGIMLDRKVLAAMAMSEPTAFKAVAEQAKAALPKQA